MNEKTGLTLGTKCSEKVYDSNFSYSWRCTKRVTVEREGKPYCTIHDPEYIKEKERKRKELAARRNKADNERYAWEAARNTATRGLTLEELQRVTPQMIRDALKEYEDSQQLRDLEIYRQAGAD